ncbi:hypothetical protein [Leclercia sp.]|uniref:hypothetical protein n=1 Tax=Leclercia sp. TaxID=1898428 RepID=UPI002FDE2FB8
MSANWRDNYCKLAGDTLLFDKAPPRAEVVLEVIGENRYIFAEAFRAGAKWWHWDGLRGRRGLAGGMIVDCHCKATRQPRPERLTTINKAQKEWDAIFGVSRSITMETLAPCMVCGVTGIHACTGYPVKALSPEEEGELKRRLQEVGKEIRKPDAMSISLKTCMVCGILSADGVVHNCSPNWGKSSKPAPMILPPAEVKSKFVSFFAEDRFGTRPWMRISRYDHIKVCFSLMEHFTGMLVEVELDLTNQQVRIGESDHGKQLNSRGYLHTRNLAKYIEFGDDSNVMVFLDKNPDGWLYASLPLKTQDERTELV